MLDQPVVQLADELVDELVTHLAQVAEGSRFILGIAGIPGSGKSTLAQALVDGVNRRCLAESAIAVPMDGFHYSNDVLQQMNLLALKGVPDSFDAVAFVQLLKTIRMNSTNSIPAPLFDRSVEASIAGGIVIKPEHKLCVVEGNYLLLEKAPWCEARKYFDEIWFLDVDILTVSPRLLQRHLAARSEEDARAKILSTDLPNARLILESKSAADKLVQQ